MSDEPEIRYLGDVERLTLGPDDMVVVRVDSYLSAEQMDHTRKHFARLLGDDRVVIVLPKGCTIGVLAPEPA